MMIAEAVEGDRPLPPRGIKGPMWAPVRHARSAGRRTRAASMISSAARRRLHCNCFQQRAGVSVLLDHDVVVSALVHDARGPSSPAHAIRLMVDGSMSLATEWLRAGSVRRRCRKMQLDGAGRKPGAYPAVIIAS